MKTDRLRHLFNTMRFVRHERFRHLLLPARYQVGLTLASACFLAGVTAVFWIVDPVEPRLIVIDEQHDVYVCLAEKANQIYSITITLLILVFTLLLMIWSRNLPDEFNDLLVLISFTPAFFVTDPALLPLGYMLLVLVFHGFVLFSLCVPRVVWNHFGTKGSSHPKPGLPSAEQGVGKLHGGRLPVGSQVGSHPSCTCCCTCLHGVSAGSLTCQAPGTTVHASRPSDNPSDMFSQRPRQRIPALE